MNNLSKILLLLILIVSCKNETNNNQTNIIDQKETIMNDTIPKVTGIGGIFFRSKNPKETRE